MRHTPRIKKTATVQRKYNQATLIPENKSRPRPNKSNNYPQTVTAIRPLAFPENPEKIMWRPPPRESLLHRQQIKMKLGRPEDRLDGQRPHLTKTQLSSALPPFPSPPQIVAKKNSPSLIRIASSDSKIGRKRQGLESLVNLSPLEETENNHDASNS